MASSRNSDGRPITTAVRWCRQPKKRSACWTTSIGAACGKSLVSTPIGKPIPHRVKAGAGGTTCSTIATSSLFLRMLRRSRVPEFDLEQFYVTDAPARARAFMSEEGLPHIDTADSLADAMNSSAIILPGLFGIVGGMPNLMVNGKRRLVANARKKLYRFQAV